MKPAFYPVILFTAMLTFAHAASFGLADQSSDNTSQFEPKNSLLNTPNQPPVANKQSSASSQNGANTSNNSDFDQNNIDNTGDADADADADADSDDSGDDWDNE